MLYSLNIMRTMARKNTYFKAVSVFIAANMLCSNVFAQVKSVPLVGNIARSEAYSLPFMRGVQFDPANPFKLDFILDKGDVEKVSTAEKEKLVRYFLAALTIPEDKLWVNLSPYEQDRVIEDNVAETEIGETLLNQDYLLKQLSAVLTHPDTPLGKAYWEGYRGQGIGNSENKIWIKPGQLSIYDGENVFMISEATLDVESETKDKEILLSELKKEVNSGKNFAELRQMYHSVILAQWFKRKFADSLYSFYYDTEKTSGIDLVDSSVKDEVFNRYVSAYEKGAYDVIRKIKTADRKVKKRYFSGGVVMSSALVSQRVIIMNRKTLFRNVRHQEMEKITIEMGLKLLKDDIRDNLANLKSVFIKLTEDVKDAQSKDVQIYSKEMNEKLIDVREVANAVMYNLVYLQMIEGQQTRYSKPIANMRSFSDELDGLILFYTHNDQMSLEVLSDILATMKGWTKDISLKRFDENTKTSSLSSSSMAKEESSSPLGDLKRFARYARLRRDGIMLELNSRIGNAKADDDYMTIFTKTFQGEFTAIRGLSDSINKQLFAVFESLETREGYLIIRNKKQFEKHQKEAARLYKLQEGEAIIISSEFKGAIVGKQNLEVLDGLLKRMIDYKKYSEDLLTFQLDRIRVYSKADKSLSKEIQKVMSLASSSLAKDVDGIAPMQRRVAQLNAEIAEVAKKSAINKANQLLPKVLERKTETKR